VLVWAKTVGIDEPRAARTAPIYQASDMNSAESVYSPDPTVRFRRLLGNIWWVGGPFYGVTRSMILAATRWLHPRHMSGDEILLTELSLRARYYELPEEMFFCGCTKTRDRGSNHAQRPSQAREQEGPGPGPIGLWHPVSRLP